MRGRARRRQQLPCLCLWRHAALRALCMHLRRHCRRHLQRGLIWHLQRRRAHRHADGVRVCRDTGLLPRKLRAASLHVRHVHVLQRHALCINDWPARLLRHDHALWIGLARWRAPVALMHALRMGDSTRGAGGDGDWHECRALWVPKLAQRVGA